jgi:predicted helicase
MIMPMNLSYDILDSRIANTYAQETQATNKNSLYDSYIKAFRWSSDRLDDKQGGVIAFVTNGAWLDGNSADGFRKTLEKEFSSIWVFNLRGNARTQGELRRKEAGNVFESGSRTPISITLLVKNPEVQTEKATIHYRDIGDYLKREEKLTIISNAKSIQGPLDWKTLMPNKEGDWINLRDERFSNFINIADRNDLRNNVFNHIYSNGIKTQRDAWCYNSERESLFQNLRKMAAFYENQRLEFENSTQSPSSFISRDSTKIAWTESLIKGIGKNKPLEIHKENIRHAIYRPFFRQFLYYDRFLNERVYQMPKIFPTEDYENLIICVPGAGDKKDFSCLMANKIVDLGFNGATQCLPLYYYDDIQNVDLFSSEIGRQRKSGIAQSFANLIQKKFNAQIDDISIFSTISMEFSIAKTIPHTFENDLKKMLPRIPLVDSVKDFWAFSKAGRKLADLHVDYEDVTPYSEVTVSGDNGNYHVTKMKFPKKGVKDTIIYNSQITISNIPEKAYEYVVNGKSAIEWIMERYQIKTDKKSGITNDPNDWCDEVNNPRYILDLLLSIINVSVQTVDIVNNLPKLNFEE